MNKEQNIKYISIDMIYPNRFQPRLNFDEAGIEELANSIKEHGIIQPLVLRQIEDKYEIVAGERRYKAAIEAGLATVPAIVLEIDDKKSAEIAIIENIQRRNLNPIEEAISYKALLDKQYLTQSELAKKMGLSQSAVANKLRLLNLVEEAQKALLSNQISERHARSLLVLTDHEEQKLWLQKIITERLTVRQLDEKIKEYIKEKEEDLPLVRPIDFNAIKKEAADLPKLKPNQYIERKIMEMENEKKFNSEIIHIEQAKNNSSNNFFNFLESETVNMNTEEINLETEIINEQTEKIDDKEENNEKVENNMNNNFIENNNLNQVFDPVDLIETLEPDYNARVKESLGLDLKSAINEIRNVNATLKNKGFKINIEELDLNDSYRISIEIKKI